MVGEIRDRETAQIAIEARAHRPPRPLHAAHQRRAGRDHAPDRDGHRAVPGRQRDRLRRRPAPGAHALPALQGAARSSPPTSCATTASRRTTDVEAYEPVGCARCGGIGLQGPHRPLRGHDRHRGDPRRSPSSAPRADRIAEVAVRARHAPPARRRPREGHAGPHLDRRGRPRHVDGLGRRRWPARGAARRRGRRNRAGEGRGAPNVLGGPMRPQRQDVATPLPRRPYPADTSRRLQEMPLCVRSDGGDELRLRRPAPGRRRAPRVRPAHHRRLRRRWCASAAASSPLDGLSRA